MRERPLSFDDDVVGGLRGVAGHLLRRAGDEVRDDGIDSDALARDRDARLTRCDERDALSRAAERVDDLERRRHLPHRRIRADSEDDERSLAAPAMPADRMVGRWLAELAHPRVAALRRG